MQIIISALALWLLGLSIITYWIFNYFRKLSKQVGKGNLIRLLEKILDVQVRNSKYLKKVESGISAVENEIKSHIQKVGLIRYNPFQEMGGNHSFSLALLNNKDDGVIITGLHSRQGTRVYVKNIKCGKCKLGLSNEEEKALKMAQKS